MILSCRLFLSAFICIAAISAIACQGVAGQNPSTPADARTRGGISDGSITTSNRAPDVAASGGDVMQTVIASFRHKGFALQGLLDVPAVKNGYAILLVHGHEKTNVVRDDTYRTLRRRFLASGFTTFTWDKPGCGNSEGEYDRDQTISDSADEVVAAMEWLADQRLVEKSRIGLWGISRAGWINTLVLQRRPDTAFWMSMSPGGERDNYPYLLETNLRLEGRSQEYIDRLQNEIVNGFRIIEQGGTYGQFLSATTTFHQDPWVRTFAPAGPQSEKDYDREVMKCRGQKWTSPVNYREIMQGISCPTLAMFGEKDLVVDWKETQAFYRSALANNKRFTSLTFPDCNHALARCVSGSRREMDEKALYQMDTVCVDAMMAWLLGVVRVDGPKPPRSGGVPSPASPAR